MPVPSDQSEFTVPGVGLYEYLYGSLTPDDEDRIAVVDLAEGTETTYATLRSHVDAAAGWLSRFGVRSGDVIALQCPNSEAFIVAAHAVWRLGAVLTPVALHASAEQVAHQIRDSRATLLLTFAGFGDGGEEAVELSGLGRDRLIHLDTSRGLKQMYAERSNPPAVSFDPHTHLAALPYSSGATGLPKGVQLTHSNLVANIAQIETSGVVTRDDVVFGILPFFHIYGLTVLANAAVRLRAKLVAVPRFHLESFLSAHEEQGVTLTFIAPPVAVALAKHPAVVDHDLSTLRAVVSGAAPLDDGLARAVESRLGIRVYQGYGLTEAGPVTHLNTDDNLSRGSIGRPVPGTEHKLVDPGTLDEIPVPVEGLSADGELWVRGPQVMVGYLGSDEATAVVLPGDGWLRTGDLARQDAAGHVYIVDRLTEIIRHQGQQVAPAELEALLLALPDVADAAVVGVSGEDAEEIPEAFVVRQRPLTGDDRSDEEVAAAIMDAVNTRVEPYKTLRAVEFIAEVPRSATGKTLRRKLRES
ncbi:AMP-binding protein [Corynebacterium terpenotabidum]|uniref:Acyl-CoA synthetase n=1 Tax=Corynebacterium terpenotabidum Y-11 TaxID=1200352 RepID=S4XF99_9CORY|nr:AMP-binding protein [Corynebacterium terpenotabidum]AGP30295.1 acyl-CoA synthetase [Corynebacterium terpenotabidum Y-11]